MKPEWVLAILGVLQFGQIAFGWYVKSELLAKLDEFRTWADQRFAMEKQCKERHDELKERIAA